MAKLYIDFSETGFSLKDFKGMANMEVLVKKAITADHGIGDSILIDRPTHSSAVEFFEILELKPDAIRLKHTGGIT